MKKEININAQYIGYDAYINNMLKSVTSVRELNEEEKQHIENMIKTSSLESVAKDFVQSLIQNKLCMNKNMHNGRSRRMNPRKLKKLNEEWSELITLESLLISGLNYISSKCNLNIYLSKPAIYEISL